MMRKILLKARILLALLILSAVLFACFPVTAFAADHYQILKIGDKNDDVLALQTKLKEQGFFSGSTTGYYGTKTQQAVIDYQASHSLLVDGKAGPKTLASILGDDFVVTPKSGALASGNMDADFLEPGDKGTFVSDIQEKLKKLEYYNYPSITGYYGPVTEQAVRSFQSTNGIKADGIVGPETMTALNSENAKSLCIYPGDRGNNVVQLQKRLSELGYFSGAATGYFGTVTADALKEFQAQNGLVVDAKAGKNSREVLYSDKTAIWDGIDRVANGTSSSQSVSDVQKMLAFANEQLEKPYVYATEGPSSFDCSGFVYYVLKYMGVSTRRCSADAFSNIESWTKISDRNALVPGDILFFLSGNSSRINHIGIYLGDDSFIHASSSKACVTVSNMSDYYDRSFSFARRIY